MKIRLFTLIGAMPILVSLMLAGLDAGNIKAKHEERINDRITLMNSL